MGALQKCKHKKMSESHALQPLVFQSVQQLLFHYCGAYREVIHDGKSNLARCKACFQKGGVIVTFRARKDALERHLTKCEYTVNKSFKLLNSRTSDSGSDLLRNFSSDGLSDFSSSDMPVPKRRCLMQSRLPPPIKMPDQEWIDGLRERIVAFIVGAGIPFRTIENEQFMYVQEAIDLFLTFREAFAYACPKIERFPQIFPGRASLARTYLERLKRKVEFETNELLTTAKTMTLSLDTWTNIGNRIIMGVVLHLPSGRPVVYAGTDVTDEGRDASAAKEKIANLLSSQQLTGKISAVVTDSASVYVSAKRMLEPEFPEVIFLPCFAHQVNIIISDCMKTILWLDRNVKACIGIVAFFASPSRAAILTHTQEALGVTPNRLVKMPRTRWNYACRTLRSVRKNRRTISTAFIRIADPELKFDIATRSEARKCEEQLKENDFWDSIDKSLHVLDVLAEAQDLLQQDRTPLRMVLPAMKKIHGIFDTADESIIAREHSLEMQKMLTMRMQKSWNVDLLILSTVLDPEYKDSLFDGTNVNIVYLTNIAEELYEKLFGEPAKLGATLLSYLLDRDPTLSKEFYRTFLDHDEFESPKQSFWEYAELSRQPCSRLARLALHLESCVCTTAATERLFSEMGHLHSSRRNRLRIDNVVEMVKIRRLLKSKEGHHPFQRNHIANNGDQEVNEPDDAEESVTAWENSDLDDGVLEPNDVESSDLDNGSAIDDGQRSSTLKQGSDDVWEIEHEDLNDASYNSALWTMSDIFSSISS